MLNVRVQVDGRRRRRRRRRRHHHQRSPASFNLINCARSHARMTGAYI